MSKINDAKEIAMALVVLLACLVALMMFSSVSGQEPSDVRIKSHGYEDGVPMTYHGSGTVIYSGDEGSWVLTAKHNTMTDRNTRPVASISVMDLNGKLHQTNVAGRSSEMDVALLWSQLANITARPLAADFAKNEPVWINGWPYTGETFRSTFSQPTGTGHNGTSVYQGRTILGQSGGAIVDNRGYTVGDIAETDGTVSYAYCGERVFDFVSDTVAKHGYKTQCAGGRCQIQPPGGGWQGSAGAGSVPSPRLGPRPTPRIPFGQQPILVETNPPSQPDRLYVGPPKPMDQGMRDILAELESIKANNQKTLDELAELRREHASVEQPKTPDRPQPLPEPGETGPSGTQVPPGPAGPVGETIDIDAIVAAVLAKLPKQDAPMIDIEAITRKVIERFPDRKVDRIVDGKVVASGALRPGDTLQIIDQTKKP